MVWLLSIYAFGLPRLITHNFSTEVQGPWGPRSTPPTNNRRQNKHELSEVQWWWGHRLFKCLVFVSSAAMTNTTEQEVHQQKGSVSQSGSQKSQIKMAPGLVPSGAVRRICSSPHPSWLLVASEISRWSSPCLFISSSFYVCLPLSSFPLFIRMPVFIKNHFYKDSIGVRFNPKYTGLKCTPMILFSLVQLQRHDS